MSLVHGLVAAGLLLRLYHYGRNPSMWHDEAATVINVLDKGFGALLGPLQFSATGPPLFLWWQRAVTLALGDSTYALRLVSFLASAAGLVLFARLARRLLTPALAAGAVLLVACSDRLLWHAAEARHYSTDFLIAVVLLLLFTGTETWPVTRRTALFTLLAPLVIFGSYPGVFLCGGLFAALWPDVRRRRRASAGAGLAVFALVIVAAFALVYFGTLRLQRSAAMDAAWAHTFAAGPWRLPWWAVVSTVGVIDYMTRPIGSLLIVPAAIGAARLWRTRRDLALLAVTPLALAMVAAVFRSYPYTGARTMVFAMPGVLVLIAAGGGAMIAWAKSFHRPAVTALAVVALAIPLAATSGLSIYRTVVPWRRADTAGASAYVLASRRADDPVTANSWEAVYYFRGLGSAFYPELRVPPAGPRPQRLWVVITAGDASDRHTLLAGLGRWRVLDRREFTFTTVSLVSRTQE
jgi:4-amino-4-deoxy-L-arabinose transferase-like glycosyltransferase